MSTTIDQHLPDDAMDAYVEWRELCIAVQEAYDRWTHAPRSEAAGAFLDYTIALDREEHSSLEYAVLAGPARRKPHR